MCEQLAGLKAPAYLARVTCNTPANIKKAREAIKKAFEYQMAGKGFSMVEIMSNCPTNWGLSPLETLDFMKENTLKEYELGEFRAV
jgi:2-oxoglutarate ferredoxin oxidoreductase subunit beta